MNKLTREKDRNELRLVLDHLLSKLTIPGTPTVNRLFWQYLCIAGSVSDETYNGIRKDVKQIPSIGQHKALRVFLYNQTRAHFDVGFLREAGARVNSIDNILTLLIELAIALQLTTPSTGVVGRTVAIEGIVGRVGAGSIGGIGRDAIEGACIGGVGVDGVDAGAGIIGGVGAAVENLNGGIDGRTDTRGGGIRGFEVGSGAGVHGEGEHKCPGNCRHEHYVKVSMDARHRRGKNYTATIVALVPEGGNHAQTPVMLFPIATNEGGENEPLKEFLSACKQVQDYTYVDSEGHTHTVACYVVNDLKALWGIVERRKIINHGKVDVTGATYNVDESAGVFSCQSQGGLRLVLCTEELQCSLKRFPPIRG